jgi:hypothetical protein
MPKNPGQTAPRGRGDAERKKPESGDPSTPSDPSVPIQEPPRPIETPPIQDPHPDSPPPKEERLRTR